VSAPNTSMREVVSTMLGKTDGVLVTKLIPLGWVWPSTFLIPMYIYVIVEVVSHCHAESSSGT
jgi:hypothetical protein